MLTKANIKNFLRDFRKNLFCRGKEQNIDNYQYFIFINSKVTNIVDQIFPHFEKGFLDKNKVLIVYKHHFESVKYIQRDIKKYGLQGHCIINLRDIPSVKDAIWIYTHNSMHNFAVINKNLYSTHIWIGHGDSEKIAYYKKMIRIYDYIFVVGDLSIERFITHKIFSEGERYKFIRIGKSALCSVLPTTVKDGEKAILFAPTWEGAMVEENYSTLHLHKENAEFIKTVAKQLKIDTIIIKLHPNTGIRDSKVVNQTIKTVQSLLNLDKKLIFVAEKGDWVYGYIYNEFKEKLEYRDKLYQLQDYKFEVGVANISAMTPMIDIEGIKTFVLYDKEIEVQERVNLTSGEKINLRDLKSKYDVKHNMVDDLVNYEENWNELAPHKIFKEVERFVENEQRF
jgi:hypothetical protein